MNYRGYVCSPGSNVDFLRKAIRHDNGLRTKCGEKQSVSRIMCMGFLEEEKSVFKNRKLKRTFSDVKLKS